MFLSLYFLLSLFLPSLLYTVSLSHCLLLSLSLCPSLSPSLFPPLFYLVSPVFILSFTSVLNSFNHSYLLFLLHPSVLFSVFSLYFLLFSSFFHQLIFSIPFCLFVCLFLSFFLPILFLNTIVSLFSSPSFISSLYFLLFLPLFTAFTFAHSI